MNGNDLRASRAALGLSQAELAARLGVAKDTISRWERGVLTIDRPLMLRLALERLEMEPSHVRVP